MGPKPQIYFTGVSLLCIFLDFWVILVEQDDWSLMFWACPSEIGHSNVSASSETPWDELWASVVTALLEVAPKGWGVLYASWTSLPATVSLSLMTWSKSINSSISLASFFRISPLGARHFKIFHHIKLQFIIWITFFTNCNWNNKVSLLNEWILKGSENSQSVSCQCEMVSSFSSVKWKWW